MKKNYIRFLCLVFCLLFSERLKSQELEMLYYNGCWGNVENKTVLMLNGTEYNYSSAYGINVEEVRSVKTEKGKEKDKIIIETKEGYTPDIESLQKIIEDRFKDIGVDYIAVLDGRTMVGNYKNIVIDKNIILNISKDNIDINTVKRKIVLIRTKSSLYKKKYIR